MQSLLASPAAFIKLKRVPNTTMLCEVVFMVMSFAQVSAFMAGPSALGARGRRAVTLAGSWTLMAAAAAAGATARVG